MKKALLTVLFFSCVITAFAQPIVPLSFKPIKLAEFSTHGPVIVIVTPAKAPMGNDGTITVVTKVKTYVFKPGSSSKLYINVGDLIKQPFTVVRCMQDNKDRYYLINKNTGSIDTLFSLPIFFSDRKKFASIGGAELAGGKQLLQVGQFAGGRFTVTKTYQPTPAVYMSYLFWINERSFFVSDHNTKYYKVELGK